MRAKPCPTSPRCPSRGETEMHVARFRATAAPLPNGAVLIAGGEPKNEVPLRSAELFNPTTDTFTLLAESGETELQTTRVMAVAAPLPDGQVLIAGGGGGDEADERSAELFNPATDTFTALPASGETELRTKRFAAVAAPLPNGKVLIASGSYTTNAELFNSATDTFTALPAELHIGRYGAIAAPLPGGRILIAGGDYAGGFGITQSAEIYNSAPHAEIAGGYFGVQTVSEPAAEQVLTATNVGSQNLEISGASISAPTRRIFRSSPMGVRAGSSKSGRAARFLLASRHRSGANAPQCLRLKTTSPARPPSRCRALASLRTAAPQVRRKTRSHRLRRSRRTARRHGRAGYPRCTRRRRTTRCRWSAGCRRASRPSRRSRDRELQASRDG
jgi:hypothetical protein